LKVPFIAAAIIAAICQYRTPAAQPILKMKKAVQSPHYLL
jgi:hypothetical protein